MFERIYVVTDLGPGDGGKGGIVHALSRKIDASIVIKRGGAQGSHGVRTSNGESFNFSQWGCGTLEGVPSVYACSMFSAYAQPHASKTTHSSTPANSAFSRIDPHRSSILHVQIFLYFTV